MTPSNDFLLDIHMHAVLVAFDEDVVGVAVLVLLIGGHQGLGDFLSTI